MPSDMPVALSPKTSKAQHLRPMWSGLVEFFAVQFSKLPGPPNCAEDLMSKWCQGLISFGLQVFVTIMLVAYQLPHVRKDEKGTPFYWDNRISWFTSAYTFSSKQTSYRFLLQQPKPKLISPSMSAFSCVRCFLFFLPSCLIQ